MQGDDAFQLGRQIAAMFRLTLGEGVLGRQVGVRHMVDAGQQRAEHLSVGDDAADRDAAEIERRDNRALAADQAETRTVALHAVIGERHLQRRLERDSEPELV